MASIITNLLPSVWASCNSNYTQEHNDLKIYKSYNLHTSNFEFSIEFGIKLSCIPLFTKLCKCGLVTNSLVPSLTTHHSNHFFSTLEKNICLTQALYVFAVYFLFLIPLLNDFSHLTSLNSNSKVLDRPSLII